MDRLFLIWQLIARLLQKNSTSKYSFAIFHIFHQFFARNTFIFWMKIIYMDENHLYLNKKITSLDDKRYKHVDEKYIHSLTYYTKFVSISNLATTRK